MANKTTAIKNRFNKTQILNELAENTDLSKKDVTAVLDELSILIQRHIKKRSGGEFVLPGLLKIQPVKCLPIRRVTALWFVLVRKNDFCLHLL